MTPCHSVSRQAGNAIHPGGESMTKVKFFQANYDLEYQDCGSRAERFPHYQQVPFYPYYPFYFSLSTQRFLQQEKSVFSSDFLPSRVFAKIFPG
jgi:hypothetical protein